MVDTKFSIIVACTNTGGIGKDNTIPWYIPEDLKHFKKVTTDCPKGLMNAVVMGRNTWESLPRKPLPSRINIIVSSQLQNSHFDDNDNTYVVQSVDDALQLVTSISNVHETFIIGGSRLYKEALDHPQCYKAYITHVHQHHDCDVFFPLDTLWKSFSSVQCTPMTKQDANDNLYTLNTYLRN
jgi:dihydrofolate reductase